MKPVLVFSSCHILLACLGVYQLTFGDIGSVLSGYGLIIVNIGLTLVYVKAFLNERART